MKTFDVKRIERSQNFISVISEQYTEYFCKNILGALSWPAASSPGYYCIFAERVSTDERGRSPLVLLAEGKGPPIHLFKELSKAARFCSSREFYADLSVETWEIPRGLHGGHVFLNKGDPIGDFYYSLKKACKDAGITYGRFAKNGFIFHDLRHTFNTYMRKAGVSESVIMEITGHSTRQMFDRYNTVDMEDTRQAVIRYQDYLKIVDQSVDLGLRWVSLQNGANVRQPWLCAI